MMPPTGMREAGFVYPLYNPYPTMMYPTPGGVCGSSVASDVTPPNSSPCYKKYTSPSHKGMRGMGKYGSGGESPGPLKVDTKCA